MTDRLKAWCHWKRLENHVSEDDLLMVRHIEALLEENAKLRAVAKAGRKVIDYLNPMFIEADEVIVNLREAFKKLGRGGGGNET